MNIKSPISNNSIYVPCVMTSFLSVPQKLFTVNPDTERALVFPAVNSFSRFCLHTLVKDSYPELTTFSVGTEKDRRPVVCHQSTVAMHALKANDFVINVSSKNNAIPKIIENSTENMIQTKNDENSGRNNNDNNSSNGGRSRKRPGKTILQGVLDNRKSPKSQIYLTFSWVSSYGNLDTRSFVTGTNSDGFRGLPVINILTSLMNTQMSH